MEKRTQSEPARAWRRAWAALALLALVPPAGAPDSARAAASPWAETEQGALRLIAAADAVGAEEVVRAGLHFRLKEGWKIYWRSPGDAGYPPRVDWSGSRNLAAVEMRWPVPKRFSIFGFETVGYAGEVVLPVDARLAEAGKPMRLDGSVDYLTCKDICIPYQASVALELPAGPASPSEEAHLLNRFSSRVPGAGGAHGITIERAEALTDGKGAVLRVVATATTPLQSPDLFVEGPQALWFSPPRTSLGDGGRTALLEVKVGGVEDLGQSFVGTPVTVTVADGERAAERRLNVAAAAPAAPGAPTLIAILGLALLGGLILNLMPCVLPVLSLKVMSVVGHGGGAARDVRLGFLATTAGILMSMLALAAALAALKAAGATVGWGIQFQQPWFLVAMTLVVTLFASNLWGFFEFRLPGWAAEAGARASHVHGLGGHLLSGAFVTLLATPCTAPFLGTAVGFALARGTAEIFAIFAALGLGLAAPYLLVAAAPGLATRLPRPGRWMLGVRGILGGALALTAAWLLSVLASQAGAAAALVTAALVVLFAAALYAGHRMGRLRALSASVAGAIALAAFLVPPAQETRARDEAGVAALGALWVPFREDAIPRLVADGKVVFVDVTADWCITCQVNKAVVLARGEALRSLTAPGVVAMRADWTRPDDGIARYLARFGRYGIPFDAVYGPAAPDGIALPELLTEDAVLAAFARASGKALAKR